MRARLAAWLVSLLDSGPDSITVFPTVVVNDDDGNPALTSSDTGVIVLARVQPSSTVAFTTDGQLNLTIYTVIARYLPDCEFSKVEFDGDTYDVLGDVLKYRGSARTQHMTFQMQLRGA